MRLRQIEQLRVQLPLSPTINKFTVTPYGVSVLLIDSFSWKCIIFKSPELFLNFARTNNVAGITTTQEFFMAKSKSSGRGNKQKKPKMNGEAKLTPDMAATFFDQALSLLHGGQPTEALPVAKKILTCLSFPTVAATLKLPALDLIGEIYIELGEPDEARKTFLEAVELDPQGLEDNAAGAGADKFLWLAQLCEEGGEESVKWFDLGASVLRRELGEMGNNDSNEEEVVIREMKIQKLANALCGAAEVYMTDLS